MINVYELFDHLQELLELKVTDGGFVKMVQTGACSLCDYNRGFLAVVIYLIQDGSNGYCCRVSYQTIDDGDFGGWSKTMSKEDATELMNKVADYYRDIVALPSDEEVNKALMPLGMYVFHE